MSTYNQIFQKNHYDLKNAVRKSEQWFQQQVTLMKTAQRITPSNLMRTASEKNRTKVLPGEMYMFYYDPKMKDTLPYWDSFPLVFPFRVVPGGFLGLNMHYLPYKLRVVLLDRLALFRNNSQYNEQTRLKLSWNVISGMSRSELVKPCVHKYLAAHVKSPFKKIEAQDWTTALMLPVEQFVGAAKQQVWTESLR